MKSVILCLASLVCTPVYAGGHCFQQVQQVQQVIVPQRVVIDPYVQYNVQPIVVREQVVVKQQVVQQQVVQKVVQQQHHRVQRQQVQRQRQPVSRSLSIQRTIVR